MPPANRFTEFAGMALSGASQTKYEERDALLRLVGMWIDAATTAEDAECPRHGAA